MSAEPPKSGSAKLDWLGWILYYFGPLAAVAVFMGTLFWQQQHATTINQTHLNDISAADIATIKITLIQIQNTLSDRDKIFFEPVLKNQDLILASQQKILSQIGDPAIDRALVVRALQDKNAVDQANVDLLKSDDQQIIRRLDDVFDVLQGKAPSRKLYNDKRSEWYPLPAHRLAELAELDDSLRHHLKNTRVRAFQIITNYIRNVQD